MEKANNERKRFKRKNEKIRREYIQTICVFSKVGKKSK